MDSTKSLLAKPIIDGMLAKAKRNRQKDGYVVSVLFAKLVNGQGLMTELGTLLDTDDPQQRRTSMARLGRQLRGDYGEIKEAVMIFESWCVSGREPGAMRIAPSQHPARQEAICIYGRNAGNTRRTVVLQPFTLDAENRLVWKELLIADYNRLQADQPGPPGLLDYLFGDDPAQTNN